MVRCVMTAWIAVSPVSRSSAGRLTGTVVTEVPGAVRNRAAPRPPRGRSAPYRPPPTSVTASA
jgi:hypothetical protein